VGHHLSGERRYRAALQAGFESMSCQFVEAEVGSLRVLEEKVVENGLRESLTPVDQAQAFKAVMDANGWSARTVVEELGLACGTVRKALALLISPRTCVK
jgi:ParB family chromosome partitioning protein